MKLKTKLGEREGGRKGRIEIYPVTATGLPGQIQVLIQTRLITIKLPL